MILGIWLTAPGDRSKARHGSALAHVLRSACQLILRSFRTCTQGSNRPSDTYHSPRQDPVQAWPRTIWRLGSKLTEGRRRSCASTAFRSTLGRWARGGCWPCCASRPARTGSGSAAGLGARNVTAGTWRIWAGRRCFPAMGSRRDSSGSSTDANRRRAGSLTHPETNSVYADARPRSATEVNMALGGSLHHARGLRPGVVAFADELRRAGHTALRTR